MREQNNIKNFRTTGKRMFWCAFSCLCLCLVVLGFSVELFLVAGITIDVFEVTQNSRQLESILQLAGAPLELKNKWYSLYTSSQFNTSLSGSIENCTSNPSFFPLLPDPIVQDTDVKNLNYTIDINATVSEFKENLKQVPFPNVAPLIAPWQNMSLVLDPVVKMIKDTFFHSVDAYFQYVTHMDVVEVLDVVEERTMKMFGKNATKVLQNIHKSRKAYASLMAVLLGIRSKEFEAAVDLVSLKKIKLVPRKATYLLWTVESLSKFLENESVIIFSDTLNSTLISMIDSAFYGMNVSSMEFRASLQYCDSLMTSYNKWNSIYCQLVLYPVASAWFGMVIMALFLIVSCLLAIRLVPLFVYSPAWLIGADTGPYTVENALGEDDTYPVIDPLRVENPIRIMHSMHIHNPEKTPNVHQTNKYEFKFKLR